METTIDEAVRQLPALIDAAIRGEMVVITLADQTSVRLVPVDPPRTPRRAGTARGLILKMDDFEVPLEDFRDYTR